MPGSANASAAIIPGSDPDHTSDPKVAVTRATGAGQRGRNHDHSPNHATDDRRADHQRATNRAAGRIHGARRERLAAERTTDILRIVVTKRRERRLDRRRLGTIFLMAGQSGHHHVEQLGIDKRQRIA